MTGRISHITAYRGLRLAWSGAGFVYLPDSDFLRNLRFARGPSYGLYSYHGLYSYGLYSYGLYSYGL